MNIEKTQNGSAMTIALNGRLDLNSSPALEHEIMTLPEDVNELIFDMEKLEYISSAGLRILLMARKMMSDKGSVKVIHTNEIVKEVFEITGFSDILTIE